MNSFMPLGERAQSAVGAVGNKISEKTHEVTKAYHQAQAGVTPVIFSGQGEQHKIDIKHAGIAAQEHAFEMDEKARFEAHKNIVMDSDKPVSERAEAAVEAVANLLNEKAHEANKAYHLAQAGLTSEVITGQGHREQKPTIKHAASAATEHAQEIAQKEQFELHKNIALNSDKPVGERTQAALGAVGNLISEKAHEANKAYHQTQAGVIDVKTGEGHREQIPTTTEKIKHIGLAAAEHALEIDQKVHFEENKKIALNEDIPIVERAQAAVGAVGSKISELAHEVTKEYHRNLAGLSPEIKEAYASGGIFYETQEQKPIIKADIKHAGWAAKEHAQEINEKEQFELHQKLVSNPDLPVGDRAQAAVEAVGNKISEKTHEVNKVYHQYLSGLSTTDDSSPLKPEDQTIPIDKIKHIGLAAKEHSQEINEKAEFEVNKNLAMNPDLPATERAQAALGAVGNKLSEKIHESNKVFHQSIAGVAPDVITQDLKVATEIQKHKSATKEKFIHIGKAATEHALEIDSKEQFEEKKSIILDSNLPVGERTQAALEAVGNKISETIHESNKIYHQNLAGLTSETDKKEEEKPILGGKIQQLGIAATEHAKEIDQKEQFELHQKLASNPDLPVGDRAQAAVEAVANKISEKVHEANKALRQNLADVVE